MKLAFAYHVFFIFIIFYISQKISKKDYVQIYEKDKGIKLNKGSSTYGQLKRLLYKKTGFIMTPLESVYYCFYIFMLFFIFSVTPFFEETIYETSSMTQNGTLAILTIIFLSFFKLIAPRNLIEQLGKEYFVSAALSQLLIGFVFAMMFYLYGTMKIEEMVVYQATSGFMGLPNWGLVINPFLFISVVSILALSEKSRGRKRMITTQVDTEGVYGPGKEALVEAFDLINALVLTLLVVLLFMGGYHLPEIKMISEIEIPGFKIVLQSIVILIKTYFLLSLIKFVKKITTLRSDYRLNRLKVLVLFPSLLLVLLVMPVYYFGRG